MSVLVHICKAALASFTVEGLVLATCPAYSTVIAVIKFLLESFVVKELANSTEVLCKLEPTTLASLLNLYILGFFQYYAYLLLSATFKAFNFLNSMTVYLMTLLDISAV